jgi:hypothetical protein
MAQPERRRAPRLAVNLPTLVEKIGHRELHLHPNLVSVYERVHPDGENLGLKFPAAVRDLSSSGCFVAGTAMPLLSRVAMTFALEGYGQLETIGWVLWRRRSDAEITLEDGRRVPLKAGFGVLFEAIPLEARVHIDRLVRARLDAEAGG